MKTMEVTVRANLQVPEDWKLNDNGTRLVRPDGMEVALWLCADEVEPTTGNARDLHWTEMEDAGCFLDYHEHGMVEL